MDDFLTDTKSKLCKMVASFNDIESERRLKLGPLIPEGDAPMDRFASIADTFKKECKDVIEKMMSNCKQKGAQKVEQQSRMLMTFCQEEIKPKEALRKENIELRNEAQEFKAEKDQAIE